jgi:hypothetical protein
MPGLQAPPSGVTRLYSGQERLPGRKEGVLRSGRHRRKAVPWSLGHSSPSRVLAAAMTSSFLRMTVLPFEGGYLRAWRPACARTGRAQTVLAIHAPLMMSSTAPTGCATPTANPTMEIRGTATA